MRATATYLRSDEHLLVVDGQPLQPSVLVDLPEHGGAARRRRRCRLHVARGRLSECGRFQCTNAKTCQDVRETCGV